MLISNHYELTIDELSAEVVRLLKANHRFATHLDNRVSAAPDMRTIRYYSTLGLIDRPTIKGRVAKYHRRHLLQLLAIKTMQSSSLPLSDIQERLYGLSEDELESLISAYGYDENNAPNGYKESIRTVVWREILLEPGLKILADESWTGETSEELLEKKIRAAIETFKATARGANGEIK